ncbi:MAG: adenosylcobinamide-phosphate synthase CbiB [Qingshengfaniella sp.]
MTGAAPLAVALVLDALFGEPAWLWRRFPHPAVLMGRLIGWMDTRFNHPPQARRNGVLALLAMIGLAGMTGATIAALPLAPIWEILVAAILLAQNSLAQHVRAVAHGLRRGTGPGRQAVALIVGRDVAGMDSPAVARAAIESAAENLSDGVIAPLFWFLVAGLPGMVAYKIVNTADSMIGYRTPRHAAFGWAAARCDDLLNLIPARLTAALILIAAGRPLRWRPVWRDARLHRSPNAGWPEAAMAVALNVALSGPRSYDGEMRDFPWVWPEGRRTPGVREILRAVSLLWRVWALTLVLITGLCLI